MLTGFSKFLFDKMPPKQRIKIPAEATDAEREALMEELKMERRISKREFTRKKNLFDRMLNEDDPTRRDRQRLAELTMEELTIQFNTVMEKNRNVELNLKEEVRDDYMAEIEDSMKETQLMYLRFQIAGEPEEKPKDDSVLKPSRREDGYYSAIGRLTYDVRKVFMGLQGPSTPLQLSVAGGGNLPQTMEKKVKFQLQSVDGTYTSKKMEGLTTKKITRDLRKVDVDTTQFDHLKGINFTETYPRPEKEVDILIGVEDFTALMSGPVIRGNPEDPSAIATKLGYVLSGSA